METKIKIDRNTREIINNETGEVILTETDSVYRVPQTPDFVMAFTQDMSFISNISGGASKLLFGILSLINRSNEIYIVKEVKEKLSEITGLKFSSISVLVSELHKKNVIIKKNAEKRSSAYVINPYYFGKGKWVNVNKLRMIVEYDFINSKRTFGVEAEYIDEKDDYIGQLINNQDYILDNLSKNNNILVDTNKNKTINFESERNNVIDVKAKQVALDKEDNNLFSSISNGNLEDKKRADIITSEFVNDIANEEKLSFIASSYEKYGKQINEINNNIQEYFYRNRLEVLNDISKLIFNCEFQAIEAYNRKKVGWILNSFEVATELDKFLVG
ncbi:hypothetical protein E3U40_06360 [Campylobacter fetus subsp. venerealis]|uniref:hypothetical protein n=1 Tax=Campylobacter TaxID=194 RepID=UPI0003D8B916|nr:MULTISPECIES: hypothetical protein [Campylobacter]AHE95197.1 hypothetical protein CFVI03293_A0072 [Campylobacter fetus subsp. venerealis cfvi03/293]KAA3684171.1 hypothetical protein E3U40_06360 [Campylobacter fetus subsp. venerealis]OCS20989.1 hypothetical protein CFVI97532_09750 [Campylobacter fetus subsp. venerealis cfvi97/532]TWO28047.1 hypothetical protein YZ79_09270 [Campylobacter hyointestinalis]